MNSKQKNLLIRIIIAAILWVPLFLISEEHLHVALFEEHKILLFLFFLIPYLLVGYDILRKAFKGIMNKQVFDENFLMTVATVGAIVLGEYGEAWPLCCSIRSVSCSRVMLSARAAATSAT